MAFLLTILCQGLFGHNMIFLVGTGSRVYIISPEGPHGLMLCTNVIKDRT